MSDLPWLPATPDPTRPEREARGCRRHTWHTFEEFGSYLGASEPPVMRTKCMKCGKARDDAAARRGRTARNRGNGYEREVAEKLGGRRVGQYGDKVDVQVDGYLRAQCKNGGAYPERIDAWLRAIPIEAGILRAVVIGDAPGPGRKRRSVIVFDLDEWAAWHGRAG